jgi:hypothetical protein
MIVVGWRGVRNGASAGVVAAQTIAHRAKSRPTIGSPEQSKKTAAIQKAAAINRYMVHLR